MRISDWSSDGCSFDLADTSDAAATPAAAGEVNLYTTREPGLIQPLLHAFTARSGIAVNTVFLKDGLMERLSAEGANSPADVLMTVDTGNLHAMDEAGHPQELDSARKSAVSGKRVSDSITIGG